MHAAEESAEPYLDEIERLRRRVHDLEGDLAALKESQGKRRPLIEDVRDLVWTTDLDLNCTYISPSVLQIRGFSVEEAMRQPLSEFVTADSLDTVVQGFQSVLALENEGDLPGSFSRVIEFEATCKDGSTRWLEGNVSLLRDAAGAPIELLGVARDITDRRLSEEALRSASRMEATATLAGGMAHDVNNLMVGVLGNATLIREQFSCDPEAIERLRQIEEAAAKAGELAQQALAFSRGGRYRPEVLDLNQTLRDVLELQMRNVPAVTEFDLDLAQELQGIKADANQLSQLLVHFCDNAADAINGKGTIRISTEDVTIDKPDLVERPGLQAGDYVRLTIADTGCGMEKDVLARIFEPYFTTKVRGRGLALAAAYGIIKNHGGFVYVDSTPGHGTVFQIYFPAAAVPVETHPAAHKLGNIPGGSETILVIDDEDMVMEVTRQLLERLGYRVLCASNGVDAIEIARTFQGRIHAALLDMGMPVMGGAETYPLLAKFRPDMKILICSGFDLDEVTQDLLNAGACAFIQKPFRAHELGIQIRQAVEV